LLNNNHQVDIVIAEQGRAAAVTTDPLCQSLWLSTRILLLHWALFKVISFVNVTTTISFSTASVHVLLSLPLVLIMRLVPSTMILWVLSGTYIGLHRSVQTIWIDPLSFYPQLRLPLISHRRTYFVSFFSHRKVPFC